MDSNYIFEDLAFMLGENIRAFFHKNGYGDSYIEVTNLITEILMN